MFFTRLLMLLFKKWRVHSFRRGKFPLTYFSYLIDHRKIIKIHFSKLMKKVYDKLQAWKDNFLSFGGKFALVNNILNNIFIYLFFVINSLCIIPNLYITFHRFYKY